MGCFTPVRHSEATLTLVVNFFWLLVGNEMSPTKDKNLVTWDREIMVVVLVTENEIDFARMILTKIHERAFKTSTT